MATPRQLDLVRCYLPTARMPYGYVTQEGFGRTPEEAREHAGWKLEAVAGEELSTASVFNYPARDDKDSARIAHELCNWALNPESPVPVEVRDALLALFKKRLYADGVDFFFTRIQDEGLLAQP
ncbi:MAG: hypothetical protein RL318_2672 [Fibrobacterota bacterium]|jgi:hypothetical protein